MDWYLWIKTLHVVSSVVLVGTGFGSAFYLFMTHRSGSVAAQAVVSRLVVKADWWMTTPAVILQPLSGLAMVHLAGWPLTTPWVVLSLGLFGFAGLCWLPVVALQIRMARLAATAHARGDAALPEAYWRMARWWERLGYPAFAAMLVVFALMVIKPALWA
ncbi:MAG: DUF2269 domain-containing protein [Burkholderiaceae bacterium]